MERAVLNPATSEPGGGVELWASRLLNLAWLPRCDNWHNPSLLGASVREAVPSANTGSLKSDQRPVWYWRVEPTFAAWVVRAIHRASERQVALSEAQRVALLTIREWIENQYPDQKSATAAWAAIESRGKSRDPPNAHDLLPGFGLLRDAIGFASVGLCEPWEGYERDVERFGYRRPDPETSAVLTTKPVPAAPAAPVAAVPVPAESAKRPSRVRQRSVVVGPDLFSAN